TPHHFPGVHIHSHASRVYPFNDVAAHLIGLRKPTSQEQTTTDSQGQGGVEEQYQFRLAGKAGNKVERINRRGEVVSSEIEQAPQDGADLVLTIDSRLQRTAESLLDAALADASAETIPVGGV